MKVTGLHFKDHRKDTMAIKKSNATGTDVISPDSRCIRGLYERW